MLKLLLVIAPPFTGAFYMAETPNLHALEKRHRAVCQWFYVPTRITPSNASAVAAETGRLAVTGGNGTGPPSMPLPLTGAVHNTRQGVCVVASGSVVSVARASVADTAGLVEGLLLGLCHKTAPPSIAQADSEPSMPLAPPPPPPLSLPLAIQSQVPRVRRSKP